MNKLLYIILKDDSFIQYFYFTIIINRYCSFLDTLKKLFFSNSINYITLLIHNNL
jgi:hypothetical protein